MRLGAGMGGLLSEWHTESSPHKSDYGKMGTSVLKWQLPVNGILQEKPIKVCELVL